MGLLHTLFGGGTKLDLSLDGAEVPEGGLLSGTAVLTGGKKPLKLTALKVRLLYVSVQTKPGSALPAIDTRILLDNTVAANEQLPAGSVQRYPFSLTIPTGTQPSAHNVSYKVQVQADIPGVKDPTETADFKVVAAQSRNFLGMATGAASATAEELFRRFPGLRSAEEEPLLEALGELVIESYDESNNFLAAEPLLARLIREGASVEIRRAALEAWGNILNDRARPEHLRLLSELADAETTPPEVMEEVVKAAGKFADEGAMPLLVRLSKSEANEIRREVADALYFHVKKGVRGRRELLVAMSNDPDAAVRASVFRAFGDFSSDRDIMASVAGQAARDPAREVQAACLKALTFAHSHGMSDLVFSTYERHLANPHVEARKAIVEQAQWLPANPRFVPIVERLLQDADEEVRHSMAFYLYNMSSHPELRPVMQRLAETHPEEKIRARGLAGLNSVMRPEELIPYYRQRLSAETSEEALLGIVDGVRNHQEHSCARSFLQELTRSPITAVAERARESLE